MKIFAVICVLALATLGVKTYNDNDGVPYERIPSSSTKYEGGIINTIKDMISIRPTLFEAKAVLEKAKNDAAEIINQAKIEASMIRNEISMIRKEASMIRKEAEILRNTTGEILAARMKVNSGAHNHCLKWDAAMVHSSAVHLKLNDGWEPQGAIGYSNDHSKYYMVRKCVIWV
jgi:vacuolar-type H+-ATPase subunit H